MFITAQRTPRIADDSNRPQIECRVFKERNSSIIVEDSSCSPQSGTSKSWLSEFHFPSPPCWQYDDTWSRPKIKLLSSHTDHSALLAHLSSLYSNPLLRSRRGSKDMVLYGHYYYGGLTTWSGTAPEMRRRSQVTVAAME